MRTAPPPGAAFAATHSVGSRRWVDRAARGTLPCTVPRDAGGLIRGTLAPAPADVVLVSGGSSVGAEDHAPRLVAELGTLDFHGVSMRPSSPTGIGRLPPLRGERRERMVFLLPGNPVSCMCAYEFFAGPTIRSLGGLPRRWPHRRVHT